MYVLSFPTFFYGVTTTDRLDFFSFSKRKLRINSYNSGIRTFLLADGTAFVLFCFVLSFQELQRKLAEEQVAAAMGQAPPVTSVAAGAAAMGLTLTGGAFGLPGATAAATAPKKVVPVSI